MDSSYAMWSAFAFTGDAPAEPDERAVVARAALAGVSESGVTVRGWYDLAGLRADADLLVWWRAPRLESVQAAYHVLRDSDLGHRLSPIWTAAGRSGSPEGPRGPAVEGRPKAYAVIQPLLGSTEGHDRPDAGRTVPSWASHVASRSDVAGPAGVELADAALALGDAGWILAFEADDAEAVADLLRGLHGSTPPPGVTLGGSVLVGPRVELADWFDRQPRRRSF